MSDESRPADGPTSSRAGAALALACVTLLALNAPVFASRLLSVLRTHPLCITEGSEGPTIYPVWKAIHGRPVYEPTAAPPFPITWYNFLFYQTYARLLSALGVDGEGILLWGRLLTLASAALGAAGHWLVIRRLAPPSAGPPFRLAAAAVVVVAWFGTNFAAWWPLSIRPDIPAEALVTWGLWAYLRGLDRRSPAAMLAASALFFAAWGFKQSVVWTLFGVSLYTLVRTRDWRLLLPLTLPCAAAMAATFAALGAPYRANTIGVQGQTPMIPRQAIEIFGRISAQNAFPWLFWAAPLFLRRGAAPGVGPEGRGVGAVATAFACSFAYGLVALARLGSNKNHLFEPYMLGTTLALVALGRFLALPRGRARSIGLAAATALLVPMALFPAAQLLRPRSFGRIELADAAEYAARSALARDVDGLEKPLLIFDDILSQPWHSTGGRYPAFVPDPVWYGLARDRGLLEGGGAPAMIRRREFRSLVIEPWRDGEISAAREAGYRRADPTPEGIRAAGLILLVAPDAPGGS